MRQKITRAEILKDIFQYRSYKETGRIKKDFSSYEEIEEEFIGVTNGFLSQLYSSLTGKEIEVVGEVANLFICPCCSFKTLTEIYDVDAGTGYDICPYCKWEDDGTSDIDKISSVNKDSIRNYRLKISHNQNFYYQLKWKK